MNRKKDLDWYLAYRKELSEKYHNQWLVVFQGELIRTFVLEEDAIAFSVEKYGVNQASVFRAVAEDPVTFA